MIETSQHICLNEHCSNMINYSYLLCNLYSVAKETTVFSLHVHRFSGMQIVLNTASILFMSQLEKLGIWHHLRTVATPEGDFQMNHQVF